MEKYIKEEAPHKHLVFILNKCDLVPTGVAVSPLMFPFLQPSKLSSNFQSRHLPAFLCFLFLWSAACYEIGILISIRALVPRNQAASPCLEGLAKRVESVAF